MQQQRLGVAFYHWAMSRPRRTWKDVPGCRLYNYQIYCPEWLDAIFRSGTIQCSNPARFNDPWDFKPWFQKRGPGRTRVWEGLSAEVRGEIATRRVYCLAEDPLSILMWSHYAAKHTGICLEFHLGNPLFMKVLPVEYQDDFPDIDPSEMYDRVDEAVLTKAKCWEYEKEFRLIGGPHLPEGDCLRTYEDRFKLPPLALVSVIVGCNGDYEAVKKIVAAHAPLLRVSRVERAPGEYRLRRAPQEPDDRRQYSSWPPYPDAANFKP